MDANTTHILSTAGTSSTQLPRETCHGGVQSSCHARHPPIRLRTGAVLELLAVTVLLSLLAAPETRGASPVHTAQAGCSDLITNGSFETEGFAGWETDGSPWLGEQTHDGLLSGALGGRDNAEDEFYQDITLPADPDSATLSFWWYIETTESGIGNPWDFLYVEIRDLSDIVLETLETQSNTSPANAWQESNIDLTEYPALFGQTIRVAFRGVTDYSNPTTFYIDQVGLLACTTACPYDYQEPNDDFDTAATISTGISYYTVYICPSGDEDWFQFHAEEGDTIDAQIYNLPADYDLYLYDPAASLVGTSAAGGTASEQILYTVAVPGDYRVRVFGYVGAWSATQYTVRVDLTQLPTATPSPTITFTPTQTDTPSATPTPTSTDTPTSTTTPTSTSTDTVTPTPTATTTVAPGFTLRRHSFAAGLSASSNSFRLRGTLGQVPAGSESTSFSFQLRGGFWPAPGFMELPGDTTSITVDPAAGGGMTSPDGRVSISFPAGAITSPVTVTHTYRSAPIADTRDMPFAGTAFSLVASDASGNPVTQFQRSFILSLHYDESDWRQAGLRSEEQLDVYTWNATAGEWELVPASSRDTSTNTIIATLNHLSEFALLGEAPENGFVNLPLIMQ